MPRPLSPTSASGALPLLFGVKNQTKTFHLVLWNLGGVGGSDTTEVSSYIETEGHYFMETEEEEQSGGRSKVIRWLKRGMEL